MSTILQDPNKIKQARWSIIIVSIVVPAVVALLFGIKVDGYDLGFLPPIYATLNGITALLLLAALFAIKIKRQELHRKLIRTALMCSLLFLVGYVAYHMTSDPTIFGDADHNGALSSAEIDAVSASSKYYYVLLISHVLLSIFVIPVVLFTYFYAWTGNFTKHKQWTNIAFPMWLYVAVSGVLVYLLISPYYH
jgi:putative membrane protein